MTPQEKMEQILEKIREGREAELHRQRKALGEIMVKHGEYFRSAAKTAVAMNDTCLELLKVVSILPQPASKKLAFSVARMLSDVSVEIVAMAAVASSSPKPTPELEEQWMVQSTDVLDRISVIYGETMELRKQEGHYAEELGASIDTEGK